MKAIALTQPWASLVAFGAKKIETRTWGTPYRGPLAVHAAKNWTAKEKALVEQEPFKGALRGLTAETMPLGVVLGTVELVRSSFMVEGLDGRCVTCHTSGKNNYGERCFDCDGQGYVLDVKRVAEPERSFGGYEVGRYGFSLENARLLPWPVAAHGRLSIYSLSEREANAVTAQLEDLDERAGVLEHDGGLTRSRAEELAFEFVRDTYREAAKAPAAAEPAGKGKRNR